MYSREVPFEAHHKQWAGKYYGGCGAKCYNDLFSYV